MLCLFALLAPLPLIAQTYTAKSIVFNGATGYNDKDLLAEIGLRPGMKVSYEMMREDTKKLMQTGLFDQSSFTFDGMVLTFRLSPVDDLYPVRYDNLPIADDDEIEALLHKRFPLYHGKLPAEGSLTDNVRKALEELLAAHGLKAQISTFNDSDARGRKVVTVKFSITAPPVLIGSIALDGVSDPHNEILLRDLHDLESKPYSSASSSGYIEQAVHDYYINRGHAAAVIHAVRSGAPTQSATSIDVPFTLHVDEGKIYKIAGIKLPNASLLSVEDAGKIMRDAGGRVPQAVALRSLWYKMRESYLAKGYLDCVITPKPIFDEAAGTVIYTAEVTTGPVYHLGFVKFYGVSEELHKQLVHEWQMMPGDVFDETYAANFMTRFIASYPAMRQQLTNFKIVNDAAADPVTHDVNLTISLVPRS